MHYLDITTRGIGTTNTSVTGTHNEFTVLCSTLPKCTTMAVQSFVYPNNPLYPADVSPIIECDNTALINIGNTTASVLYFSLEPSGTVGRVVCTSETNPAMMLSMIDPSPNTMFFRIVRSDGQGLYDITTPIQLRIALTRA